MQLLPFNIISYLVDSIKDQVPVQPRSSPLRQRLYRNDLRPDRTLTYTAVKYCRPIQHGPPAGICQPFRSNDEFSAVVVKCRGVRGTGKGEQGSGRFSGRENKGWKLKDVNGWRKKREDRLAWWEDPWHLCTACSVDRFETREHASTCLLTRETKRGFCRSSLGRSARGLLINDDARPYSRTYGRKQHLELRCDQKGRRIPPLQ